MRKMLASLMLLVCGLIALPAYADETVFDHVMKTKTVDCGYYIWPPYFYKDANTGKLSGINYDVMEAIGKNLGLKLNWKTEVDLGSLAATLETHKVDMLCGSVWPSPARIQSLTLVMPAFYTAAYAYVRADDKRFDGNLDKANDKTVKIAAIDGDYTYDLAKEMLPQATINSLAQAASGSELLLQVITKKSDIVFSDEGLVNDFLKANPGTLRKISKIEPVRYYGETFALKRGEYQLKNMVDVSLNQLINDGVIEKLVDKYNKEKQSTFLAPTRSFVLKK